MGIPVTVTSICVGLLFSPEMFGKMKIFDIDQLVSFKISVEELDPNERYVFVLANSKAERKGRIVSFISVQGRKI